MLTVRQLASEKIAGEEGNDWSIEIGGKCVLK